MCKRLTDLVGKSMGVSQTLTESMRETAAALEKLTNATRQDIHRAVADMERIGRHNAAGSDELTSAIQSFRVN